MFSVYKHTTPNGKVYIGITGKKPEYRWDGGRGYHYNDHFSAAIKKYGWENIRHEILQTGLTKEQAEAEEIRLIKEYSATDPRYGYNHMAGGDVTVYRHSRESIEKMRAIKLGKKYGEETRRKHSLALMGRPVSPETREKIASAQRGKPRKKHTEEWKKMMSDRYRDNGTNMRPVEQFTKDGEKVGEFVSARQAERMTGCDNRNVIACCRGKRRSAHGYIWKYKEAE